MNTVKRKRIVIATVAAVGAIALSGLFASREVASSIEIDATATDVWRVLSDFSRYGEWNPFIINVAGSGVPGTPLAVTIRPAIGGQMDFNLELKEMRPPEEMIWLGETLMPNLLDGEHYFRIETLADGRVRFSQGERYDGLLLFFSWPVINWSVSKSFADMNMALKVRCEQGKVTSPLP